MRQMDLKIELHGTPQSNSNAIEDDLTAKLNALQVDNATIDEVSSLCNMVSQFKNSTSRTRPKKLRKRLSSSGRDALRLLDLNLDSYASNMVEKFGNQRSGCLDTDYELFRSVDSASQQTFMVWLPLLRLLEEDESTALQANGLPNSLSRKVNFRFLESMLRSQAELLKTILEHSWKLARDEDVFIAEARKLTTRIHEMLQNLEWKASKFSVESIYLDNTTRFASTLTLVPATSFLTQIMEVIITEQKITSGLSWNARETARLKILEHTLFRPGLLGELIRSLVGDYCGSWDLNQAAIKNLQDLAQIGGNGDVFLNEIIVGIYNTMDQAILQRCGLPALRKLIKYDEEILRLLLQDLDFKVEFEASWGTHCESRIYATKMATGISKWLNEEFRRSLNGSFNGKLWTQNIARITELFGLQETIITAFLNHCIIRRSIKEGGAFLRYLFDPVSPVPEIQVLDGLLCEHFPGECQLKSVRDSLLTSLSIQQHLDSSSWLGLVFLSEKDIELVYKPDSVTPVRLPKSLQSSWDNVSGRYLSDQNPAAYKKKLTLIPMLNTVELQMPFICSNSKPLVLQLNLLQASVLMQFDQCNNLSFQDLLDRTEIDTFHLQMSLQSLVNTGLLLQKDNHYTFNDVFEPAKLTNGSNIVRVDFRGYQRSRK
ncbi:LAFA_0C01596g1_1 [Lachancea sp. 'fantastica']|nr:LAFA_0C01596g1_1 [Lachancea sp. 'fantastica']